MNIEEIIDGLGINNKRIISRAISLIETEHEFSEELLNGIYSRTGSAYRIGITGPPGAGKSTLTNQLTKLFRSRDKTVGIIAVDPSSPFTGGALLGDRVRMNEIGRDEGVFIRSMATRGSLGGLSTKAFETADILDAAGFDYILFETVGVGQSELDIARTADTTLVVLVPESGDSIQAMKAGLMEIADLFVLNKSDRPGADNAFMSIQSILALRRHDESSWFPPVIKTVASENIGISELAEKIDEHYRHLVDSDKLKMKRIYNSKIRIKEIINELLNKQMWDNDRSNLLGESAKEVIKGNLSPYAAASKIIKYYKSEVLERS